MTRERNVWTIDAGNTALKLLFFSGEEEAGEPLRLSRDVFEEAPSKAADFFAQAASSHPTAESAVIAHAREADRTRLEELVKYLLPSGDALYVSAADALPFKVRYTAGTPGADRLANAMALRMLFPGQPAIAVDFGTATSIVVVNAEGDFLGGPILPGPGLQRDILPAATKGRLPAVNLVAKTQPSAVPSSTEDALLTGILLGHAGAVDRLVREIESTMPGRELRKIATGGWAATMLAHTHSNLIWHRNLTLLGLRYFTE